MVDLIVGGRAITEVPEAAVEIELQKTAHVMRLEYDGELHRNSSGMSSTQYLGKGDWVMFTPSGGIIKVEPGDLARRGWSSADGFICESCSGFFQGPPHPLCEDAPLCDACFDDLAENCSDFLIKTCRVCGCTDDDCSQCIAATGHPCHWVEGDLCSRCADELKAKQEGAGDGR